MPHPNRSQSSPNLRLPPSQSADTCFSSISASMSRPEPFSYNASVRRFGSRRARPSVASIADLFVGSLVMAGYCREHSPRGRGLSTISINPASHGTTVTWQGRPATRHLPQKRPQFLCLDTTSHRSTAQRMFNSGVAQKLEEDEGEADRLPGPPFQNTTIRRDDKEKEALPNESLFQRPRNQFQEERNRDTIANIPEPSDPSITVQPSDTMSSNQPPVLSTPAERYRYNGKTTPAKEVYSSASKLYRAVYGDALDWKQAVDAAMRELPVVSRRADMRFDAVELHSVEKFLEAMWDEKKSNQYVFRLYRELPHPGVSYLSKRSRGALLRRFANPTNRRWVDARRYLGLVDDMIAAGLPISRSLWSSAIHLAGRASGKVCKKDLVRSIGLWQQMEHLGGVKSDGIVFGILFDIAIKAGQFTVADRLMEEMNKRDISFSRAGKVSRIYYYGMLRDPDGIRQALDDFVASGEIVDTPVLNCLLASFLRAGDTATAESLYRRMLQSQKATGLDLEQRIQHQPGLTSELVVYRKKSRKLNTLLQLSAPLREKLPEHHRALQEAFPMAPDTRTFHILLSFHCYETGDIQAFSSVLKDMEKTFAVPPRGMIYLLLFSGFARNGRKRKGWTAERLRGAWKAYLRALYESRARFNDRLHFRTAKPTWENPLGSYYSPVKAQSSSLPHAPSGLYTPLPTSSPDNRTDKVHASPAENHAYISRASDGTGQSSDRHEQTTDPEDDEFDTDELFGHRTREPLIGQDELEGLERQVENGVFLGRRMIIIILRAFGACCGPKEVMEVWLRLERLWQPKRRRALDVLAVKEELEKQMNRVRR
ncbi:hypothetical protein BDV59DRAFT_187316 [Aspergillus ambiguus]|uniref:pentatricopeptide repeat protein n=1 Tax=Aspergillus ambiguus TaxID=176160 RepID=UPI003CCD0169